MEFFFRFTLLFWRECDQIVGTSDFFLLMPVENLLDANIDDPKGFKLEFFFDPNPHFKNTVLTKTYHMIDEDEPILEKAIG